MLQVTSLTAMVVYTVVRLVMGALTREDWELVRRVRA
jgi:hypothetical protein